MVDVIDLSRYSRFAISAEHLVWRMATLLKNLSSRDVFPMTDKEIDSEMKAIDNIYKKLDEYLQGEYHHMWAQYMKRGTFL